MKEEAAKTLARSTRIHWLYTVVLLTGTIVAMIALGMGLRYWANATKRQQVIAKLEDAGATVTDFHGMKSSVGLPKDADVNIALPLLSQLPNMWYLAVRTPRFIDHCAFKLTSDLPLPFL